QRRNAARIKQGFARHISQHQYRRWSMNQSALLTRAAEKRDRPLTRRHLAWEAQVGPAACYGMSKSAGGRLSWLSKFARTETAFRVWRWIHAQMKSSMSSLCLLLCYDWGMSSRAP